MRVFVRSAILNISRVSKCNKNELITDDILFKVMTNVTTITMMMIHHTLLSVLSALPA